MSRRALFIVSTFVLWGNLAQAAPSGERLDRLQVVAREFHAQEHARKLRWPGTVQPPANRAVDVLHYDLHITPDVATKTLSGRAVLDVRMLESSTMLTLDLVGFTVDAVTVDGTEAAFTRGPAGTTPPEDLTVTLPVAGTDVMQVDITYHGEPAQPTDSEFPVAGLVFDAREAAIYTEGEPYFAHGWFPCHDQPWDKATFRMTFDVPKGWKAASNGTLVSVTEAEGTDTYVWETLHQTSTYLVSLAARDYVVIEDEVNGLPLRHYVPPALEAQAREAFAVVPDMVKAYAALFGPYPWEKYGHATAPIGGGMENQSLTTLDAETVNADGEMVIAHELAHQWWGDMVTLADWPDVWLNEGFATFSEALWAEKSAGAAAYRRYLSGITDAALQSEMFDGVHALYNPPNLFDGTVYMKGGRVMGMLRDELGEDAFFPGWRAYGEAHKEANATTAEFQAAMEAACACSLDEFFAQWVYRAGHPEVTVKYNWDLVGNGSQIDIRFRQLQDGEPYHLVAQAEVTYADTTKEVVSCELTQADQTCTFCGHGAVSRVRLDPRELLYWEASVARQSTLVLAEGQCQELLDAGVPDAGDAPDAGEVPDATVGTDASVGADAGTAAVTAGDEDDGGGVLPGCSAAAGSDVALLALLGLLLRRSAARAA